MIFPVWNSLGDPSSTAALARTLRSWEGTRYMPGQQKRGAGVDCVRFVAAVLDELLGTTTPIDTLPPDASLHDVTKCEEQMRRLIERFPAERVDGKVMLPGDVLVTGPSSGGPGHAVIVGDERNVLWHATRPHVRRVSLRGIYVLGHRVFAVFRLTDREWGR